jgi:hypothetical protein
MPKPVTIYRGRKEREVERCISCGELIHLSAVKCKTCGSYQDVRRYLSISSTVLALLVALVSVLTFLIPILTNLFTPDDSFVEVQYQGSQQNRAYFIATNSGVRPGSVVSVRMVLSEVVFGITDERVASRFDMVPIVVAPGSVETFSVDLDGDARALIDQLTYRAWENNVAKDRNALPNVEFWINVRDFADSRINQFKVAPAPNSLLVSGPTDFHKCAGAIAWADWNGPTSNFFPQDIDPEVVEMFCGPVPESFKPVDRDPMSDPRPNAAFDVFE